MSKSFFLLPLVFLLVLSVTGAAVGSELENDVQNHFTQTRVIANKAITKLNNGATITTELEQLGSVTDSLQVDNLLLLERFANRNEKVAGFSGNIQQRQKVMEELYISTISTLQSSITSLLSVNNPTVTDFQSLVTQIEKTSPEQKHPILGTLPYRNVNFPARQPSYSSVITPAYQGGSSLVTAADTQSTHSDRITPEIAALAESLDWNPVKIYEWVSNNVETEWYWGSMKEAGETLRQKSGNDADQAALLVALLRAANFPVRYVHGVIEFFPDLSAVQNLTGLEDPIQIATFFQKAGIPFQQVIAGGRISNFQIEHVWVEVEVPYSNYRGAVIDNLGKAWIPLDTSIKPGGYLLDKGEPLPAAISIDTLREDYLSVVQQQSPIEFLKESIEGELLQRSAGETYEQLLQKRTFEPQQLKLLPASLQFKEIAVIGEYVALPDELLHFVSFVATKKDGSEMFSLKIPVASVSNAAVSLAYEAESIEDQRLIESFGGLNNTPAYLVHLRPVLQVDGERMVVSRLGLPMGDEFNLTVTFHSLAGSEMSTASHIAGNLALLYIVAQQAVVPDETPLEDKRAEDILFEIAARYVDRWNIAEEELAGLLKTSIVRPMPSLVTVGGVIDVTWLLDAPQNFVWKGLFMDAGLRRIGLATDHKPTKTAAEFMRYSALHGSELESRIFEEILGVPSASTAKIIALANVSGTAVQRIDSSNLSQLLPTLNLPSNIQTDIESSVNQGLSVAIPENEVSFLQWSGFGYLKENPQTGDAGYMLSGMIAGGMTAWKVDSWSEDLIAGLLLKKLVHPYTEPANSDPAAAVFIEKISAADLQTGTAGELLPEHLQVRVLDVIRRPVAGAEVTFTVKAGGGLLEDNLAQFTTVTDERGIASVALMLGKKTQDNPTYFTVSGHPYFQIVGANIVDAKLTATGRGLDVPLTAFAFPGPAVAPVATMGNGEVDAMLSYVGPVVVFVGDKEGNPIANLKVQFSAQPPQANPAMSCSTPPITVDERPAKLPGNDICAGQALTYDECPSTQTEVESVTISAGLAATPVILGGQPRAIYPIKVTLLDIADPRGQPIPEDAGLDLELYSRAHNVCGDRLFYEFYNALMSETDGLGSDVNARPVGGEYPIRTKDYLLLERDTLENRAITCDTGTINCDYIVGTDEYFVVPPESVTINAYKYDISTDQRGAYLGQAISQKNGFTEYNYTLPEQPGLNIVEFEVEATSTITESDNTCTSCGTKDEAISSKNRWWLAVVGVDIELPETIGVRVDTSGRTLVDTPIVYNILPSNYEAVTAQLLIYEEDRLVTILPTETSGSPFGALLKGYQFDLNRNYFAQVVLNNGYEAEILSEKIPFEFVMPPFQLSRIHLPNQFDQPVSGFAISNYIDTYQILDFSLQQESSVQVTLSDADMNPLATLVTQTVLAPGDYNIVVDFESVRQAGIEITDSPLFYINIDRQALASSLVARTTYQGFQVERVSTAKMLGQTIVHDVMLQDGSLLLSRDDFTLKGRGPQIALSRTYSNQNSPHGFKPLGRGWSHSLDLRLKLLSTATNGAPLPSWVENLKGRVFTASDISQGSKEWTVVQVNGTLFKKYNGLWYAERGKHGRLEETAEAFEFIAKDGTRYRYDCPREAEILVGAIEDRNGNRLTFSYDNLGRLEEVTDAVGRKGQFYYQRLNGFVDDNHDRLVFVIGPDSLEISFNYDDNGYLHSVQRDDRIETYEYAVEGGIPQGEFNLIKTTDSNNRSFGYDYMALGELHPDLADFVQALKPQDVVKQVTYPDLNSARFQYDAATGNKRVVTDLRGNDTTYTLNFYGNPTRIDEPLGKYIEMTWSIDEAKPDNLMTSKTVSAGTAAATHALITTYEYDGQGNITKETDPYGNSIITTWNQIYSLPESRTDRNGVVQSWNYDSINGNLNWHEDGDGKRTNYSYFPTGEVQTVTDPRLNVTSYSYDQYGNPDTVTGPESSLTDFDYDIRGRKVAETDPNGNTTRYAYDALDYPETVTYSVLSSYALPAGSSNVKSFDYDPVGNLLSEAGRTGLTLTYAYTTRNQVEAITRSNSAAQFGQKNFVYDENGNLTSETDWKGIATTHTYDELNRRDTTTNRLGDSMAMAYDLAGNLIQVTDYEGRITDYQYDDLNRQTKVVQPQLPGQSARGEIVSTYYDEADSKNNLKTVADAEGHVTAFEYNGRYQKTKRINALLDEFIWQYDDAGNLEKEIDEELNEIRYEYDKQNRRTYTYRKLDAREIMVEERQYDAVGNVRFVVDANGQVTQTIYDQWNRPYQVLTPADPVPYVTSTELDGEGREVKIIDGNGHVRSFLRDARGLVLIATDAESQPTLYTYDQNDNVETITNARGFVTRIGYDAEDRKLLTTEAEGKPEQRVTGVVKYDKVGNPLQVRDGKGNIRVTEFNGLNLPWKQYDPKPFDANYVETLYDKNGKPIFSRDRRGNVTTSHYDALGRVDLVTDPVPFDNQTLVTTYDKVGHVRTVKDKRGILSETIYDDLYRVSEQKRDGIRLVSNEYDDAGNLTASVDAEDNRIEYAYNSRNLLEKTTFIDPAGEDDYTEQFYDGVGNVVSTFNEEQEETTTTYDRENRLKTTTFAGETSENFYDEVGNLTRVQKPKLNTKQMAYDGLNRLTSVTEGALLTTAYTYDANGNQLTQEGPLQHVVEYRYDELNRKTAHIQHKPSGNLTVSYDEYDAGGNLKQLTDAMGRTFTYAYDELNRLTKTVYPQVATPFLAIQQVETGYDANNNVTTVTETKQINGGGTQTDTTVNTHDNFDRLESSDQRGMLIDYGYDNNGNRTSVETINGSTDYTFDHRNRLETVVVGTDTTTYSYTPDGLTDSISYPNGTGSTYTYWPTNRVQTITHKDSTGAVISSFDYRYDANGNRTRQVELQNGVSETTDYRYDKLDRLGRFSITDGTTEQITIYGFEGYNRKTEWVTENGATVVSRSYRYDETNWLTDTVDRADPLNPVTIDYSYDNNGNTTLKSDSRKPGEEVTFEYDVNNRLVQTTQNSASLGRYDYNAQGMRIRHYGSERGDVEYIYDDGAVLEEYSGSLLAHYRYGDRLLSLDAPSDGGIQYYHHDALGSTVNLTDNAGATKVSYSLDPWGHIRNQVGSSVNRQIFTGQEHDEQTGLIYFGARYYDPDSARFITQDSYQGEPGTPPSLHRYLYAYSNPTVFVDLMGYDSVEIDENNNVNWVVETNWDGADVELGDVSGPQEVRRVRIGTANDGKVELTTEFGGGIVESEKLKDSANYFWERRRANSVMDKADISDYSADYQDQLIAGYIDESLNPHRETRLSTALEKGLFEDRKQDIRAIITGQPQNKSHDGQSPRLHALGNIGRSITEEVLINASGEKAAALGVGIIRGVLKRNIGKKAFVIGEGMPYVKAAAKELQEKGVNAKWYQAWGKNFPKDKYGNPIGMTPEQLVAAKRRNARVIKQKIKEGFDIYDIGPDGRLESPFYLDTEIKILKEKNYKTIPYPRPTKRYK